jgi:hypothetical protein
MTTKAIKQWTDYTVGQIVWAVFDHSESYDLLIKNVGRKYIRFQDLRDDYVVIHGDTKIIQQGFGGIGRIYECEEAYKIHQQLRKIRETVTYFGSDNWRKVSDDKIQAIAKILEIPEK